jgi:hypothetical protein
VYWETNLRNCFRILDTEHLPQNFPQSCCFFQEKTWTEGNGSIRAISDHFFLCRCCLRYLFPSLSLFLGRSIWICTPLFGSFIKFRFSDVKCLGSAVFSDAHQLYLLGIAVWRRQMPRWDVASCEISNESIWWLQAVDYDLNGLSPIDTVANQQELCGPIAKHHRFVVLLYRSTCPQMILTSHCQKVLGSFDVVCTF